MYQLIYFFKQPLLKTNKIFFKKETKIMGIRQAKDVIINGRTLEEILIRHSHWVAMDCDEDEIDMRADLSNTDLSNVDLHGADLRNANLSGADLTNSELRDADLGGANLCDTILAGACLRGANLADADLYAANLFSADLRFANMCNASLTNVNAHNASFNDANLCDTAWNNADLSMSQIINSNLTNSSFYYANLRNVNLRGSNLHDTGMSGTDLSYANLSNVNLSGANLRKTNLTGVNLFEANLVDTDLTSSNLSGANLCHATGDLIEYRTGKILTEDIVGYKKCRNNIIVTLLIPKGAIVFSINGNKCRTNKAKVIAIDGAEKAYSIFNSTVEYKVGEEFDIQDFNCEYNEECAEGIHFFMTREKAEKYNV